MELTQLLQFKVIAELENISAAAEVLYISQPALTMSLHKLEKELGTPLFHRRKKRLTLNEAGQIVLDFAIEVTAAQNKMQNRLNLHSQKKPLSIGTPFIGLMRYLTPQMNHPACPLSYEHIITNTYPEASLKSALLNYEIDLAISEYDLSDDKITSCILGQRKTLISVPESNPLAQKKELEFQDLAGQPFMEVCSENSSQYANNFYNKLRQENIIPKISIINDYYIYNRLLPYTNCLALSSSTSVLNEQKDMGRVYLPLKEDPFHVFYHFNYLKKQEEKISPFIEWIRNEHVHILNI